MKRPWLPPMHVKPVDKDGNWNPDVYRALKWLISQTIPKDRETLEATVAHANSVLTYAEGVATTTQETVVVVQDAGLAGSGSITPTPPPPDPYEP